MTDNTSESIIIRTRDIYERFYLSFFEDIRKNNNLKELCFEKERTQYYGLVFAHNEITDEITNRIIKNIKFPPNIEILDLGSFCFSSEVTDTILLPSKLKELKINKTAQLKYFTFQCDLYKLTIMNDYVDNSVYLGENSHESEEYIFDIIKNTIVYDLNKIKFLDNLQVIDVFNLEMYIVSDLIIPNSVHTLYCNHKALKRLMNDNIQNVYINIDHHISDKSSHIIERILSCKLHTFINLLEIHFTESNKDFQEKLSEMKVPYGCVVYFIPKK